ncbi:MAG: phosphatase PAP2 family protein [Bacteroidota bacterium]
MQAISKKEKVMQYIIAVIGLSFVVLTVFVFYFPNSVIDHTFSVTVQSYQHPVLDWLMKAISWPGYMPNTPVIIAATAIIFLIFKYKREAVFILLTSLSGAVSSIIKLLIDRPRPSEPLVKIMLKTHQQSFPSGHVLFYVVFFGFITVLMFEVKNIPQYLRFGVSALCLFIILTIPYSRVYLGAHWFTDVTAGFMLGLVCLYILSMFYLKSRRV